MFEQIVGPEEVTQRLWQIVSTGFLNVSLFFHEEKEQSRIAKTT